MQHYYSLYGALKALIANNHIDELEAKLNAKPTEALLQTTDGHDVCTLQLQRHLRPEIERGFVYSCSTVLADEITRKGLLASRVSTRIDSHGATLREALGVMAQQCWEHRRLLRHLGYRLRAYVIDDMGYYGTEALLSSLADGSTQILPFDSWTNGLLCELMVVRAHALVCCNVTLPAARPSGPYEIAPRRDVKTEIEASGPDAARAILRLAGMSEQQAKQL